MFETVDAAAVERELNARAAFEMMLSAVLKTAILSGAVSFASGLVVSVADGFLVSSLAALSVHALGLAVLVFFGGFIGAIVAGVPLFLFLEREGIRRGSPYVAAAVLVNLLIFVILTGGPPAFADPAGFLYLLPGAAAAVLFLRAVAPIWRRPAPEPGPDNVIRLH